MHITGEFSFLDDRISFRVSPVCVSPTETHKFLCVTYSSLAVLHFGMRERFRFDDDTYTNDTALLVSAS